MITVNNKLILEPYSGSRKVEAKGVSTGFATVKQKTNLIGLKVLVKGFIGKENHVVQPGDVVYFTEEILYTQQWSKKTFECESLKEPFILAESTHVVAVGQK